MRKLGNRSSFVMAALAGVALAGIIAVRVHLHSGPPSNPQAPARNRPQIQTNLSARSPTRPVKPVPTPSPPSVPVPIPGKIEVEQAGFALLSLKGTNWIQDAQTASKLPFYQLKIAPEDLLKLDRLPRSDDRRPATFVADGVIYDPVGVRNRGDWARTWPKKALKVFFDKDKPFETQHALNLNSGWRDPAFVREPLAYHVYEVCGVPSPKARMVRLHVNGQFRGLYVEVEQPDKPFLSRYEMKGASIYKAVSTTRQSDERNLGSPEAYARHYEKETRKSEGFDELHQFCQELEQTTNVVESFTREVDVEKYINYLAATVLVQNWDCPNKNHFLIFDGRSSGKWLVVPWDLDRTFGDHWRGMFTESQLPILLGTRQNPSTTGWNRMAERFLSEPTLRARFLDRLAALLEKEFTPEKLFPVLDRWESEIAPEAAMDRQRWGGGGYQDLHSGIAQIKRYIQERRAYLLSELPNLGRFEQVRPPQQFQTGALHE